MINIATIDPGGGGNFPEIQARENPVALDQLKSGFNQSPLSFGAALICLR